MSIKYIKKSLNIFINRIDNINNIYYNINIKIDEIKNKFYKGGVKK